MTYAHARSNEEYLRTKVLTAPPEQLQLMLLEGSVRFARQGRDALAADNREVACDRLLRAQSIVLELTAALREEHAADLCGRLRGLFTYIYRRLVEANVSRDLAAADDAIGLLDHQRQTWQMLIERLHEDQGKQIAPARPARPRSEQYATSGASLNVAV